MVRRVRSLKSLYDDWPDCIICLRAGPCELTPEIEAGTEKVYVNTCACYRWTTQMEL